MTDKQPMRASQIILDMLAAVPNTLDPQTTLNVCIPLWGTYMAIRFHGHPPKEANDALTEVFTTFGKNITMADPQDIINKGTDAVVEFCNMLVPQYTLPAEPLLPVPVVPGVMFKPRAGSVWRGANGLTSVTSLKVVPLLKCHSILHTEDAVWVIFYDENGVRWRIAYNECIGVRS